MDWVLVLILTFLLIRQSFTHVEPQQTHATKMCPPGYWKKEQFQNGTLLCEECKDGYTEIENIATECHRCSEECDGNQEVIVKNCTTTSDIKCACREGTYSLGSGICRTCCSTNIIESCKRKECQNHLNCKNKCMNTVPSRITPESGTTSMTTSMNKMTRKVQETRTLTSNPSINQMTPSEVSSVTWVILLLTAVMALCLLAYLFRNLPQYQRFSPCWSVEKDVRFNEHQSDESSNQTTLIISSSVETPMISLSAATPERPAHIAPLLPPPTFEPKVDRNEEHSEHWPAIVLYTIIKEVPLRRWKEFLRLLSVADNHLERVELEAGLGSIERQYQMLRLWSHRPSASMDDVFSALRYMDLSGCAELLMESLERLQMQSVTAHRGCSTEQEFTRDVCKLPQNV